MIPQSIPLALAQAYLSVSHGQQAERDLAGSRLTLKTALAFLSLDCHPPIQMDHPLRRRIESSLLTLEARLDLHSGRAAASAGDISAARTHFFNALNNAAAAGDDVSIVLMQIMRELGVNHRLTQEYSAAEHFLRQARIVALDLDDDHPFCKQLREDMAEVQQQIMLAQIFAEANDGVSGEADAKRVAAEKELLWTVQESLSVPTEEDAARSESSLRQAIATTVHILGDDHPLVSIARNNVALSIMAQREPSRLQEAMKLLLKARAMLQRLHPQREDQMQIIEANVVLCKRLMGQRGY